MAKLTKTQTANLTTIWTTRTAHGLLSADGYSAGISKGAAAAAGFGKVNGNSVAGLLDRGLVRIFTTTHRTVVGGQTYRVQVLVLTDAGRAAIGV